MDRHDIWIIGTDGSAGAAHAADWATAQAPGRARLLRLAGFWTLPVAPAVPPVGPMTKYWDAESFAEATRASVEEEAQRLRSLLGDDAGVEVDTVIAEGQASSHLVSVARDAELLVVGSRGRGGFARLVLGSTSSQCVAHADTPTAVVREQAPITPVSRVLVADDGSATAQAALDWAVDFATEGSTVEVVQVWEPTTLPKGADDMVFVDAHDRTREEFDHRLDDFTERAGLGGRGITLERAFVDGRARQEIAARAADVDLLVAGARGTGGLGGALLGSVSSWLLHHVETPIVIVPTVDDPPDAG